jgi:hypothetical protein
MPEEKDERYNYNRFGSTGTRVGQAVADILSRPQAPQTVGDVLESAAADFAKEMHDCLEKHHAFFDDPFYVFVLTKKEFFASNVVRNWFVPRQTPPYAFDMMEQYPNHTKTLYLVDYSKGNIKVLWSLPGFSECIDVARHPERFDPELVKWVEACFEKKLDKNSYSFDWSVWT